MAVCTLCNSVPAASRSAVRLLHTRHGHGLDLPHRGGRARDEASVRAGLKGNLCRCTGYNNIVKAVLAAAQSAANPAGASGDEVLIPVSELMTPAAFVYRRASSVSEAIKFLVDFGDEAKALAGGHSLLPIMKLRMSTPAVVIDLDSIRGLDYIRREGGDIAIGALARHADLEDSDLLAAGVPLLKRTAASVGDPQIRHRGTLGGSVAHGDPAADLPAALMALGATLVAEGPSGRRSISIDDFYRASSRRSWRPTSFSSRCGCRG